MASEIQTPPVLFEAVAVVEEVVVTTQTGQVVTVVVATAAVVVVVGKMAGNPGMSVHVVLLVAMTRRPLRRAAV